MSRALRIEFPGAIYHVMARGVGRRDIFLDDTDRHSYLDLIGTQVESGILIVHSFCLMANHSHTLCETPFGGLSRCMHDLLGTYARLFNRRHGRVGHLFQGRFRALLVQDGDYLVGCSRYIHLNPDGREQTRPMERYPWSSFHNYSGGPVVADWVTTSKILSYFGGVPDYLKFLEEGRKTKIANPFDQAFAGVILGDEGFTRKMREFALRTSPPDLEVPARRLIERWGAEPDLEKLCTITNQVFGRIAPARRKRILAYSLWRFTWLKGVEIAERLGRTPGAVSQSVRFLGERVNQQPELRAGFEEIERRLKQMAGESGLPGPAAHPHPDDWYRKEGQAARRLRRRPWERTRVR